jgi:hypothetical protein
VSSVRSGSGQAELKGAPEVQDVIFVLGGLAFFGACVFFVRFLERI